MVLLLCFIHSWFIQIIIILDNTIYQLYLHKMHFILFIDLKWDRKLSWLLSLLNEKFAFIYIINLPIKLSLSHLKIKFRRNKTKKKGKYSTLACHKNFIPWKKSIRQNLANSLSPKETNFEDRLTLLSNFHRTILQLFPSLN